MSAYAHETLRPPAVAGAFYPAEAAALGAFVEAAVQPFSAPVYKPVALVAPHAGYRFSGRLAGRSLSVTQGWNGTTAVILSPSHRHVFDGIALPAQEGFDLPGGPMMLDQEACDLLTSAGMARVVEQAHDREHGVEVLLPFLQHLHPTCRIVPLVIGNASYREVAQIVDALVKGMPEPPLFLLSSDLSHFLTLEEATSMDAGTARMIEIGQSAQLTPAHACGSKAVAGFLASDYARGARILRLGMANSHAASGDDGRTVGYGAWGIAPATASLFGDRLRREMLTVARKAVASRLRRGTVPNVDVSTFPPELQTHMASFVTLNRDGRLRGCIGSLAAHRPLIEDLVINAVKAGFEDPRFRPLRAAELDETRIEIALLTPAGLMEFADQDDLEKQLVPGRDGLILTDGRQRGTFLPKVWESLPTPRAFVDGLKVKAGLPKAHWSKDLTVHRFFTESFSETP